MEAIMSWHNVVVFCCEMVAGGGFCGKALETFDGSDPSDLQGHCRETVQFAGT